MCSHVAQISDKTLAYILQNTTVKSLNEIATVHAYFFSDPTFNDAPLLSTFLAKVEQTVIGIFLNAIDSRPSLSTENPASIMSQLKTWFSNAGMVQRDGLRLLRFALTSAESGATLPSIIHVVGEEAVTRRLQDFKKALQDASVQNIPKSITYAHT